MTQTHHGAPTARFLGLPTTTLGRCAGALLLLMLALLAWVLVGANNGSVVAGTLFARTLGVTMLGCGAVSFLCALVARIRAHDRSWVVITAIVVTALVLLAFGADLVGNALTRG